MTPPSRRALAVVEDLRRNGVTADHNPPGVRVAGITMTVANAEAWLAGWRYRHGHPRPPGRARGNRRRPAGPDVLSSDVRRRLVNAARAARAELPDGVGITLFAFPMDEPPDDTTVHYISTADRASMVDAVKVWLNRNTH